VTLEERSARRGEQLTLPTHTVIYDGECGVCLRSVRALQNWDRRGRLEFVSSQSLEVPARFPWIPSSAFADSLQVVRASDNKTWQRAAAIEELLNILPRGKLMRWIFAIPFARPVAEKIYRWFARNRYRFGCKDHCEGR
jgi:predicted DCC family thiol-disulfide oxidoreductase YuxK